MYCDLFHNLKERKREVTIYKKRRKKYFQDTQKVLAWYKIRVVISDECILKFCHVFSGYFLQKMSQALLVYSKTFLNQNPLYTKQGMQSQIYAFLYKYLLLTGITSKLGILSGPEEVFQ